MKLKKVLSIIFILALCFSLVAGCKKDNTGENNETGGKESLKNSATTSKASATKSTTTSKGTTGANNENNDPGNIDEEGPGGNEGPVEGELTPEDFSPIIDEVFDLGGAEIVIWDPYYPREYGAELTPGYYGTYSDIIYYSERDAEQKFNCKIKQIGNDAVTNGEFVNSVLAGINPCTLLSYNTYNILPEYILGNIITPLDDYVDFNNPLLTQLGAPGTVRAGMFQGKHYGYPTLGAMYGNTVANLTIYDREALAREGIPEFRQLENEGRWDWATMLEIATQVTKDFDGDGIIDQYGMSGQFGMTANAFLASNGCRTIDTVDGQYVTSFNDPKFMRTLNFLNEMLSINKVIDPNSIYAWDGCTRSMTAGTSLFTVHQGWFVWNIKKSIGGDRNIGWCLPPKGPDSNVILNEGYASMVYAPITMLNVPNYDKILKAAIYAVTCWDTNKSYFADLGIPGGIKASYAITASNGGYPVPQEDLDYWDRNAATYVGRIEQGFKDYNAIVDKAIGEVALGVSLPSTKVEEILPMAEEKLALYNQAPQ